MSQEQEEFTQGQRLSIAGQAAAGGCGCFALLVMLVIVAVLVLILGLMLWFMLWGLLTSDSGVAQGFGIVGVVVIGAIIWLFVAAYLNPRDWRPRD